MTKYNQVTPEIAAQLQAIVGAKRFFAGDAVKDDFSHDEMPIYGKYYPEVVCEAESTEEVSAILRVCYDNNIPVTPRGAGTGLVGGCVPLCGGVVLCTTRMNKILSYDMNNLVVHIQPGVLLCDLAADALTHGLMYPPDPGEKTATVGGNVSTNAGGMRAVKYGVTRDYVLAMTVVLPDGRVMELGKTVCKTSSGYSLLHLMIGSEGTLGVITELTLKLIPKPIMDVSLLLPFEEISAAIASVPAIKLANLEPQSIEFMERDIVESSAEFTGNPVFPTRVNGRDVGAYILVTLVGGSEAELTAKMDRLAEVAERAGAFDVLVVWTDNLKKDVWAARSAFLTAIEADSKLLDEMDVVVPVDRIAEFLAFARAEAEKNGLRLRAFGHAGDGNLHIYCCANDMALDEFKRRSKAVMDKCYAKCTEFGGQVSGEHAIGHAKKQYLVESAGETAFGLMQAIKQVFDPKGILNPGKVCTNVEEG
jgi:glycolate oxidase